MKKIALLFLLLLAPLGAHAQTTDLYRVATIATLKALNPLRPPIAVVMDTATGGEFKWGTSACSAADDVYQVTPTAGPTGCWTRISNTYAIGLAPDISRGTAIATGGVSSLTLAARFGRTLFVSDFGAVGYAPVGTDCSAGAAAGPDDTAALTLAINAGTPVSFNPTRCYKITSSVIGTTSGSGLIGTRSSTVWMPAASFNNTNLATPFATNSAGIYVRGEVSGSFTSISNITLYGFRIISEVQDARSIRAIVARNIRNFRAENLEISNLPVGAGIQFDTLDNSSHISGNYIHDFTDNFAWASAPQITAIDGDSNRVNGVNSNGPTINNNTIISMTLGAVPLALWGCQTDGINTGSQGGGYFSIQFNYIEATCEGIDNFADGSNISNNTFYNSLLNPLKLAHASQGNTLTNNVVTGCGQYCVTFQGISGDVAPNKNNKIFGNNFTGLNQNSDPSYTRTACVRFFGDGSANIPTNNYIEYNTCDATGGETGILADPGDGVGNFMIGNTMINASVLAIDAPTAVINWSTTVVGRLGVNNALPLSAIDASATAVPVAFTTPGFNFNDLATTGLSAVNSSTHPALVITGNASGTGTGSWQGLNVTQYGTTGSTSGSYITGAQLQASAAASATAGNYTGSGPICSVAVGGSVSSCVGSEPNVNLPAGATTAGYQGVRIADTSPSVGTVTNVGLDSGLRITKASTARGWTDAININGDVMGTDANFPVLAGGNLFVANTTSRQLTTGIDLSGMLGGFSSAAVRLPAGGTGSSIFFGSAGAGGQITSQASSNPGKLLFGSNSMTMQFGATNTLVTTNTGITGLGTAAFGGLTTLGNTSANYWTVDGAASAFPVILPAGSATDINALYSTKGAGCHYHATNGGGGATVLTTCASLVTLAQPLRYGGVTLSNAVTGTGNMVLSASPTFTGTAIAAAATLSGTLNVGNAGNRNVSLVTSGGTLTAADVRFDDNGLNQTLRLQNYGVSGTGQGHSLTYQFGTGGTLGATAGAFSLSSTADWSSAGNRSAEFVISTTTAGTFGTALSGTAAQVLAPGTIRSNTGFNANGSAGLSATTTVRDAAGTGTCTLIFTFGLKTGGSC